MRRKMILGWFVVATLVGWGNLSQAQVSVASYMGKIELYAGEIRYLGERVDGAEAAVQSQLVTPKGSQVNVEYRLNHPQDRWTVYDVSVDGVSLVGNYRTQFSHVLQRTSFDDLLKTLRQKAGS